tara:strand:- start:551 stop:757 length:207 start_codon:yes stop_codon:yes gene_type:complete
MASTTFIFALAALVGMAAAVGKFDCCTSGCDAPVHVEYQVFDDTICFSASVDAVVCSEPERTSQLRTE